MKKSALCFGILSLCFTLLSFALRPLPEEDKSIKNFKLKSTKTKWFRFLTIKMQKDL